MGRAIENPNPIRIDIVRQQRGMSLKELAEKAEVNCRTLEAWSQRRRTARDVYVLQKIAKALQCSIEDLIEPLENYKEKIK